MASLLTLRMQVRLPSLLGTQEQVPTAETKQKQKFFSSDYQVCIRISQNGTCTCLLCMYVYLFVIYAR